MSQPIKKSFTQGVRLIRNAVQVNSVIGELEVVGNDLYFFGLTNDIVASLTKTQTLTNKTLTSPIINTPLINNGIGTFTSLGVTNAGSIQLFELGASGTDSIGIRSPDSVVTSYNIVLPASPPATGTFLQYFGGDVYGWVSGTPTIGAVTAVLNLNATGIVDNTNPLIPTINITVDGTTITGNGSTASPLQANFSSGSNLFDVRFLVNGFIPVTAGNSLDGTAVITDNCIVENFYASVGIGATGVGIVEVKLQYRENPGDPWIDVTTNASFVETIAPDAYCYAGAPVQTGVTNPTLVITTIPAGSQIRTFHICSNNTFITLSAGVQLRRT